MTNTIEICKLRNYLAAATILTINLVPGNLQAREDFYNLRYTQPSVVVNLTALGNLNPPGAAMAATPVVSMQPVMFPAGPKTVHRAKPTQIAKKQARKPVAEIAKLPETTQPKTEEVKPIEIANVPAATKSDMAEDKTEMVKTSANPPLLPAASLTPPPMPDASSEAVKPVDGNIGGRDKMVALPEKPSIDTEVQAAKPAAPSKAATSKKPAKLTLPKVAEFSAGPLPTTLTEPNAVALPPEKTAEAQPPAGKPAESSASAETNLPVAMPEVKTVTASPSKQLPPSRDLPPTAAPSPDVSSSVLPPVEAIKSDSDKAARDTALELPPLTSVYENKPAAGKEPETSITMPEKPVIEPAPPTIPVKESVMVQAQEMADNNAGSADSGVLSIHYGEAEIDLPPSEKSHLEDVISQLTADKNSRVTVIAYASGTPDQASQAKRTALARALAVRKYLMDRNISSERMDIRPLGNKISNGVPDRVDIVVDKVGRS